MTAKMHGFHLGGTDKGMVFFLPWKIEQKQMEQETYIKLKNQGKATITFGHKIAINWLLERKKKIIYHLPNGAYVVRK